MGNCSSAVVAQPPPPRPEKQYDPITNLKRVITLHGLCKQESVIFDCQHTRFLLNDRPSPGLLKRLQEAFYPKYTIGASRRGQLMPSPIHFTADQKQPPARCGVLSKRSGLALGRLVDDEMTRVTALCYLIQRERRDASHHRLGGGLRTGGTRRWYTTPATQLLRASVEELVKLGLTNTTARRITSSVAQFTLQTHQAISAFTERKWVPVATQVAVGSEYIGLCTCIDVVCEDHSSKKAFTDNARVIVEVKTGFASYYHSGIQKLAPPFDDQRSCPANHHQLQLMFTVLMALINERGEKNQRYGQSGLITHAFVMWLKPRQYVLFPLKPWVTNGVEMAIKAIL